MFKNLVISSLVVNSFINFISLAYADFKPKESPPPKKSTAQGTRGCPNRLGDLALFGGAEQNEQLMLDISVENPLILYQVSSNQPEKVLLTITQVDGKFNRKQVYQRKTDVTDENYIALKLPKLESDKAYLLTLVLLCQNRPQYGKTIHAWINLVDSLTQVNNFIQSRNIANIADDTNYKAP